MSALFHSEASVVVCIQCELAALLRDCGHKDLAAADVEKLFAEARYGDVAHTDCARLPLGSNFHMPMRGRVLSSLIRLTLTAAAESISTR